MVINSGMSFCTGVQGNCKACLKKYNCLAYAIFLLENLSSNNSSGSSMDEIANSINSLNNSLASSFVVSQQEISKNLNDGLNALSQQTRNGFSQTQRSMDEMHKNLNDTQTNILKTQEEFRNKFLKDKESLSQDTQEVQVLNIDANIGKETSETGLATKNQKVWKEKKTLFGKTKWVEE